MIKCYYIENTCRAGMILNEMSHKIPCLVAMSEAEPDEATLAVTIEARDADAPFIERTLAPLV